MEYKKEIASVLNIDEHNFSENDDLESLGFDSLATINLISFISEKVDIDIDIEELEGLVYVKDLNDFISKKINN